MPPGLSLWLIPKEPLKSKLQAIITCVADSESGPKFEPHMTIISIPLPDNFAPKLKDTLSPILQRYKHVTLQFKSLFIGSSYFMSVALSLQTTPPLLAFQRDVVETLQSVTGTPLPSREFFPHMSLYYGDTYAGDRERVASFVRSKGVSSDEAGASVDGAAYCLPDEVWVVETEGRPEEWKVLEVIKLED